MLAGAHKQTGNCANENAGSESARVRAGKGDTNHNSVDALFDVCCFLFMRFHIFILCALSQGHVGIVLAHTLPDCQVTCMKMLCVCVCLCVSCVLSRVREWYVVTFGRHF